MSVPSGLEKYLQPGVSIDSRHPAVEALAREHGADIPDTRARAIRLYYGGTGFATPRAASTSRRAAFGPAP